MNHRGPALAALMVAAQCTGARAQATTHAEVEYRRFSSVALGVVRGFFVVLPPAYAADTTARLPVVYLLHGYGGDEAEWLTHGRIDQVADSLCQAGAPSFILILPDGDRGYWVNWEAEPSDGGCAAADESGASAGGCPAHLRYDDYIAHDLVGFVDRHYRTRATAGARGLMGLSMGGTGALMLALLHPDEFRAAVSLSAVAVPLSTTDGGCGIPVNAPATFEEFEAALNRPSPKWAALWGRDTTRWWRHDPGRAAAHLRAEHAELPALRIEVGTDDPLAASNCALDARLGTLAIPHEVHTWPGAHEWRAWRAHAGASLAWLVRRVTAGP